MPLIGFAGGPFTVASYLIEGGPSQELHQGQGADARRPRTLARADRAARPTWPWPRCAPSWTPGASAVQVFDSWAGILTPGHYRDLVLPATQRIFAELGRTHPGTPTILFGVGTGRAAGLDGHRREHAWSASTGGYRSTRPGGGSGPNLAVQGNLDPALCLGTWEVAAAETREVLERAGDRPGHIFNLGHGVLPETDPGILEQVVALVHDEGRAGVEAPA